MAKLSKQPKKISQSELLKLVVLRQLGKEKQKQKKTKITRERLNLLKMQNQIERMKLKRELEKLKMKMTPQQQAMMVRRQIVIKKPVEERYFDDEPRNSDVKSAFNADIGYGDNLFGTEDWFGGERYHNENFIGDEFNNSPFVHLQLNVRRGLNPLLY